MQDRSDVGPVGCRTGEMQEKWEQDSWNTGQVEYMKGGMQDRWDAIMPDK